MSDRIAGIKAEIDADPLGRGYAGMTDEEVAYDMTEVIYRPGAGDIVALREYMILTRAASGVGSDIVPTQLLGRVRRLAGSGVSDDPFNTASTVDQKDLDAATALNSYAVPESTGRQVGVDFRNDARFVEMLDDLVGANAITAADKEAIQALSDNKLARGVELGVGAVTSGDVAAARRL